MSDVEVYTTSIVDEEANDLACNVGRNAFDGFGGYVINFRTMSLQMR